MLLALAVSCGGGGDKGPPPDLTPSTSLQLRAKSLKFDKKYLATTAGADVTLSLNNQDGGTSHNFALYTDRGARENLFRGDVFQGKKTVDYRFRAPSTPGNYFFRCDTHPDMNGTFIVQ